MANGFVFLNVFRSASSPRPSPPLRRGGEGAMGGFDGDKYSDVATRAGFVGGKSNSGEVEPAPRDGRALGN